MLYIEKEKGEGNQLPKVNLWVISGIIWNPTMIMRWSQIGVRDSTGSMARQPGPSNEREEYLYEVIMIWCTLCSGVCYVWRAES